MTVVQFEKRIVLNFFHFSGTIGPLVIGMIEDRYRPCSPDHIHIILKSFHHTCTTGGKNKLWRVECTEMNAAFLITVTEFNPFYHEKIAILSVNSIQPLNIR